MKIRSLIFVACMTLALPASGQDQSARSLLRLAQAREGIWDTILELQIRYLQRTVPAKNRPALVSYYLGRALLLRGDASAARRVLLASPHNSNLLHGRLTALWLRVAQNKNIEQSLPAPDCTPVDCLVAAERGFLLAWRENPTAGHKILDCSGWKQW